PEAVGARITGLAGSPLDAGALLVAFVSRSPRASLPIADLAVLQAELLVARGRADEAERKISAEVARNPKQVRLWVFLASLADRRGFTNKALKLIEQAEQQAGKHVEWHLLRAMYGAKSARPGNPESAAQLRKLAEDLDQFADTDRTRLALALAEAFT